MLITFYTGYPYIMNIKIKFLVFLVFLSCSPNRYDTYYFLIHPYLREGLEQPTKVENIKIKLNPDNLTVEFNWDPSIDPDTYRNPQYYFIYIYFIKPEPEDYYNKKYLYNFVNTNYYYEFYSTFLGGFFAGKFYCIITAYDFGAESPISDIIEVQIP